jgi:hypothetical protein
MDYSTITLPTKTKDRLALVKGDRSWGEFMEEVAQHYPVDDLIKKLEERVEDLRQNRAKFVPWSEVKKKLKR